MLLLSFILVCLAACIGAFRQPVFTMTMSSDMERLTLKNKLLQIGAKSNRGEFLASKDEVSDIITNLESLNPALDSVDEASKPTIKGEWELVYTDAQLFESSPFFLVVRELLGTSEANKANEIFRMHRAATATGQIGRIKQIISSDELTSKVELKVGILPGQPFSILGTVVSTASCSIEDDYNLRLKIKDTKIEDSNLPFFKSIESLAKIPVSNVVQTLFKKVPESLLVTYYIDDTMRITRNQDDSIFVYTRM